MSTLRSKTIFFNKQISLDDFLSQSEVSKKAFNDAVKSLSLKGNLSYEEASLLGEILKVRVVNKTDNINEQISCFLKTFPDKTRMPIISIMGHVDHGKTTIVDYIRKTNVAEGEAGGITQNVSIYPVKTKNGSFILIDTPGHAIFSKMRQLITKISDIIVVVVAANEGVKAQTTEIAKMTQGLTRIIAMNKIDIGSNNLQKIYVDLANLHLVSNEIGGEALTSLISAKKGTNMDDLLQKIIVQAKDMEITCDAKREAIGYLLDCNVKKGMGIVGRILLKHGIVKVGDQFIVGKIKGKIKNIFVNDNSVEEGKVNEVIDISGFEDMPTPGEEFVVLPDELIEKVEITKEMIQKPIDPSKKNFICKSDQLGKLESLVDSVSCYGNVILSSLGEIKETEIQFAKSSNATIVFWPSISKQSIKTLEENQFTNYMHSDIIYRISEQIEESQRPPKKEIIKEVGKADLVKVFEINNDKTNRIAGCIVKEGMIELGAKCLIKRNGETIIWGHITSMQRKKDQIKEAKKDSECGLVIKVDKRSEKGILFAEGDQVVAIETEIEE